MAIAWSQGKTAEPGGSGSTIPVTLDSPVSVGDLIIVAAGYGALAIDYPTVNCDDSLGNTYTRRRSLDDSVNSQALSVFSCVVATAGTPTITVTLAGSKSFRMVMVGVWIGVDVSTPVNVVAPASDSDTAAQTSTAAGTDNAATQAATTTADNCMVVAVVENTSNANAVSAGTGATSRLVTSTIDGVMEEQTKATAGSVTPNATIAGGSGTKYLSVVLALTPAPGAGATKHGRTLLGVG